MKNPQSSRLAVILPSPLKEYVAKGEVKPRHYNPENVFDEVHFISFCDEDDAGEEVQYMVGQARFSVHTVGRLNLLRLPFLLSRVGKLLKSLRPKAVRAYDPLVLGWLAVRSARRLGIPSVISVHSHFNDVRRVYWEGKEFIKAARIGLVNMYFAPIALRGATKVIGAYQYAANYASKLRRTKVEVIYNRVDTNRFRPPASRPIRGRPKVLCVGRLIAGKGQETLLRAIVRIDVDLILVGEGPDGERLRALARDLGIADRVQFIPAVPHDEIHKLYVRADIFAIPIQWGGVCIPVLEAMAAGLPVVVPQPVDEPVPEVVGGAGIVVANTPAGFRGAIQQLVADPGLRLTLGTKARARLVTMDGTTMEAREAALYQQLLALDNE